MPQAYADDLRRKLLDAYDQGRGGLKQLAELFGVSYGWAQKIAAARRRTGHAERPPGARRGFPSKLTPELCSRLRAQIELQPASTLVELQQWLFRGQSVEISVSRLCTVLRELGLRRGRNRSAPPRPERRTKSRGTNPGVSRGVSKTRRPRSAG
jgi:transposase